MRRWFLSYHSPDQLVAERLKAAIEQKDEGARVFFAPTNLQPGGRWAPALADAIAEASAFVLLVTHNGVGRWQEVEYEAAFDRHVNSPDFPIVLVLLEGQAVPRLAFVKQLHWIVTTDPASEKEVARLIDAVRSGSDAKPGELWRYTSPYRGLSAMEEKDSDYFFGRERETVEVLNVLATEHGRIPVLLGNSGVGKSSLAQAGVIASLRRQAWPERAGTGAWPAVFRNSRGWCFIAFKPGAEPITSLVEAFLRTWQYDATDPKWEERQEGWVDQLVNDRATLRGLLDATERRYEEIGHPKPPAFFLYVDQGEELYVRGERQRWRFSQLLAQAIADPRFVALMSMRSDFLGQLQSDESLFAVHRKIDVPPLREEELSRVIREPARQLSARFESEELVRVITHRTLEDSAEDVGALPLLSYTLDDMWTDMGRRGDGVLRLPTAAFELGGVLAERANAFLVRNPQSEATLRRVLTTRLATVRKEGDPARRRARRSEFSDDEWRLVSELADHPNRLLVTATPEGSETYAEVAHEAIFRRWDKLRDWINLERDFLTWKTALDDDRHRWHEAPVPSKTGALLFGLALAQAQSWAIQRGEDLSRDEREFIELSRRRDEQERAEKDRLRRRTYFVGAIALLLLILLAADKLRQQRTELDNRAAIANDNFVAAVRSAQVLLDRLSVSVDRNEISADGAKVILRQAQDTIDRVRQVGGTLETTGPFIKVLLTVSDIYAAFGNNSEAYAYAKEARDLAEPLRAADPENPKVLELLYQSIWRLGDLISLRGIDRGTQEQALTDYLEAEALARQLAGMAPRDLAPQRELMFIHQKIGDLRLTLGEPEAAIAEYRSALTLIQNVAATAPENRNWRRDIANAFRRLGQALATEGDLSGAETQLKKALEILGALAQEEPKDDIIQSGLARTHREIADVYKQRGQLDAALTEYKNAIEIQTDLIAKDPNSLTWQSSLASLYAGGASILKQQGDFAGALEQYRKAYELRYELARPANPNRLGPLAIATLSVVELLESQRQDLDEAVRLCRDTIGLLDRVRPRYDRNVFECHMKIGDIRMLQNQPEQALNEYKLAQTIARDNAAADANSLIWQRNLATSFIKIGDILAAQKRSIEALESYQRAVDVVTALAARYPQSAEWSALLESLRGKIKAL
jgi:tetratricopeptide (TPR) repeat protein